MTAADLQAELPKEGTYAGMMAMLDFVAAKGMLAPATANGIKTGVMQVANIDGEGWEGADVREVDEEVLFKRFRNLKMNTFSEGTKSAYTNRFHQARAMYLARLADQPDWVNAGRRASSGSTGEARAPRKRTAPAPRSGGSAAAAPTEQSTADSAPVESGGATAGAPPNGMVRNTYFLSDNTFATFLLPRRLTAEDADFLAGILKAQARRGGEVTSPESSRPGPGPRDGD